MLARMLTSRLPQTLAALSAAAAALLVSATAASAAPTPTAHIVGPVFTHDGGTTATVTASYRCFQPTHLWVSAKQMNSGSRDPALELEGSSAYADSYLQQHPTTLNCDGRLHVQAFTVDKTEVVPWSPDPVGKGALGRGWAWVQFCMTTEDGGLTYPTRWARVL